MRDRCGTRSVDDFRESVRAWLSENLPSSLVGAGGPGSEHELVEERIAWERQLGAAGGVGDGWPGVEGGRGGGPGGVGHIGEQLLGPTLLMFGSDEQKKRFLPGILDGTSLWCQGYSEPDAGSDLAGLRTRAAVGEDGQWRVNGQKGWTD